MVVGEEANGEWEEKGNQKSVGLDFGLRTLCVHMFWWVDISSAGSYPSLLLWHVPGGHGRDHLVAVRVINPRYYYQLSSSAGLYPSLLLWHCPGGHGRDHLVVARVINPRYYYQLSSSKGYKPVLLVGSSSEGYKPTLLVSVCL